MTYLLKASTTISTVLLRTGTSILRTILWAELFKANETKSPEEKQAKNKEAIEHYNEAINLYW